MFESKSKDGLVFRITALVLALLLLSPLAAIAGPKRFIVQLADDDIAEYAADEGDLFQGVQIGQRESFESRRGQALERRRERVLSRISKRLEGEQKDFNAQASSSSMAIVQQSQTQVVVEVFDEASAQELATYSDSEIAYIEEDRILTLAAEPGDFGGIVDQRYFEQWALHSSAAGIRAPEAWDLTRGSDSVVVAVLDTGVTSHSDLNERLLPGADLVSNIVMSNNGKARHNDASDPGDWIEWGDSCFNGQFIPSSWHGTHVAATVGAKTANGTGVAGVDWHARVLPVRVLGKCGGFVSDIADGIRWAVGIDVPGLESNPNPADVINLSLGGQGSCSQTMQHAIDQANARGAVVVAASGNHGANLNIQQYSPANCRGVLTVSALDRQGRVTGYSNLGDVVDIAAPGGDSNNGVISALNSGQRSPQMEGYAYYNGTSMAAPHVSGVVSLIRAINPGLYPAQIRDIVRTSAASFRSGECHNNNCGAGKLDAYQALVLAEATEPDEDFRSTDPVGPTPPGGDNQLKTIERSGGCGTIVDISNLPPGGGGNAGAMALSFMLLLLLGPLAGQLMRTRFGHSAIATTS